jgi:CheY-like chemotaxis protein
VALAGERGQLQAGGPALRREVAGGLRPRLAISPGRGLSLGSQVRGSAGVRVLVVEDCRSLAVLMAEGLSDQGIAADVAYDGTEAAAKLGLNSYDVVVLDRRLPGVPGDTLCRMISSSDALGAEAEPRPGSAHGRLPRLPERRAAPGAGLGRERRPFHKDGEGHHQQAPAQAGRTPSDRNHGGGRVPARRVST